MDACAHKYQACTFHQDKVDHCETKEGQCLHYSEGISNGSQDG